MFGPFHFKVSHIHLYTCVCVYTPICHQYIPPDRNKVSFMQNANSYKIWPQLRRQEIDFSEERGVKVTLTVGLFDLKFYQNLNLLREICGIFCESSHFHTWIVTNGKSNRELFVSFRSPFRLDLWPRKPNQSVELAKRTSMQEQNVFLPHVSKLVKKQEKENSRKKQDIFGQPSLAELRTRTGSG